MRNLELLAPARNADIGIAAIDCGADAVYIAGPDFGARKDAGNRFEDIARLCSYAHRFGARIFLTVNILLRDDELEEVHSQMLRAQQAGVDAFIIRDTRICSWKDITKPLHASTQCAIRDSRSALSYLNAGCSRVVLERQLSLQQIRRICSDLHGAEVEFFVHGALCMSYSGQCTLSEHIDGRSADRGECIQACRSLYDLQDESGRTIVRNKALLSLRDYKLEERIPELAQAGVCSFKIEGRLKNASYVKNVTRQYSIALDRFIAEHPGEYRRTSFGTVRGGFSPDTAKTFNRGYTTLFIDGKRERWASIDAPKGMGEDLGRVAKVHSDARGMMRVSLEKPCSLANGDGFAFVSGSSIVGFRADLCEGRTILAKAVDGLKPGMTLYRNISAAFEKALEKELCIREMSATLSVQIARDGTLSALAESEDGRRAQQSLQAEGQMARDRDRMLSMIEGQLGKRAGIYSFRVVKIEATGDVPMIPSAQLNALRRSLAEELDSQTVRSIAMDEGFRTDESVNICSKSGVKGELMRSKYCLKYELGMCPVHQGAKASGRLFLANNGRRFEIVCDCHLCEMRVATIGDID